MKSVICAATGILALAMYGCGGGTGAATGSGGTAGAGGTAGMTGDPFADDVDDSTDINDEGCLTNCIGDPVNALGPPDFVPGQGAATSVSLGPGGTLGLLASRWSWTFWRRWARFSGAYPSCWCGSRGWCAPRCPVPVYMM